MAVLRRQFHLTVPKDLLDRGERREWRRQHDLDGERPLQP
jgi:hypothetical protein